LSNYFVSTDVVGLKKVLQLFLQLVGLNFHMYLQSSAKKLMTKGSSHKVTMTMAIGLISLLLSIASCKVIK